MCDGMSGPLTVESNVVYVVSMRTSASRATKITACCLAGGVSTFDRFRIRIPDYSFMPVDRGRQIALYLPGSGQESMEIAALSVMA